MMRKQKETILFMAQIPPPVHGAALRNESILKSKLINADFRIIPLPLQFAADMKTLGKLSFRKLLLMIAYIFRLIWTLVTKKIDLAYFTMSPAGGAFYRDILFITILKVFRKKCLLHFRVKGIKQTANSFVGRSLVKFAFKGSNVICLSQHHTQDLLAYVSTTPYIVPNGIIVEEGFPAIAARFNKKNTVPKILFLSNLSIKKGVLELLDALEILKKKGHTFSVSLVGSEWDMTFPRVQELIDNKGLQDVVTIEGPKYNEEKLRYFAEADIFVFPTYFELFPGVILEAMQFGKAIISTFEGSIPEMIDNHINGILVREKSVPELADAICFLLENPQKRGEIGELAKQKFFSNFTLPVFENRMNMVFKNVTPKN